MSDHHHIPQAEKFDAKKGAKLKGLFLGAAGVGLVGAGATFVMSPKLGAHAWLFAFFYFFTVLVGCFFWNCLHHATDSEWSVVVRRQIENLASLLRYISVAFVPVAAICIIKPDLLYHWFKPDPQDLLMLGTKSEYLSIPYFWVRACSFFVLLFCLSTALRSRSMAQDKDGTAGHTFAMRKIAIAGIPTLALCLTFAGFDWLKALNHHWYSTMWGVYLFAGAAGASMALIVLTCKWLQSQGYLKPVTEEHYHLMGKFLFAFTVFWAYIGFSQYMLITYANIDEETSYFRLRNTGSWNYLSMFLVFGRFFFMFVPLLFQGMKKSRGIIFCASWILFMQFLDMFIIIIPQYTFTVYFEHGGDLLVVFWAAFSCIFPWLGIAGCLGLLFLKHLGQGCVFPTKDPRLAESLKFTN